MPNGFDFEARNFTLPLSPNTTVHGVAAAGTEAAQKLTAYKNGRSIGMLEALRGFVVKEKELTTAPGMQPIVKNPPELVLLCTEIVTAPLSTS